MSILVTLCTYNEVDNLRELLPLLLASAPTGVSKWMKLISWPRSRRASVVVRP